MNSRGRFATRCFSIIAILSLPSLWMARAQSTFSANVVGYVDLNLSAGTNLIGNPLNVANNTISNLFSPPLLLNGVPDGSYFVSLDPGSATYGISNHFSRASGWSNPNDILIAPNAAILWVPSATKITFIGDAWATTDGPGCLTYTQGDSFSSWFPQTFCGLCENPDVDCPPPYPDGTTISKWNSATASYINYGYFSFEGVGMWVPSPPQIAAGEGFRIFTPSAFNARSPFGRSFVGNNPVAQGRRFGLLRDLQRDGTNFLFRLAATNGSGYSLLGTTNLHSGVWQVLQTGTGNNSGGFTTFTAPMTNRYVFFKVHPPYGGGNLNLIPRLIGRGTTQFAFDFYAPTSTTYRIERTATLQGSVITWLNVTNVVASSNTLVTAIDSTATNAAGYYRVSY
jgi:hypothetical protein